MPGPLKGAQRASFEKLTASQTATSASPQRRPSRGRRALLRAFAISLPVLALAPAAAPAAAHDGPSAASSASAPDRRVRIDARPGVTFTDHGVTVMVPPRGGFVWGELKLEDGTWQEVGVETTADGRVLVTGRGDERAAILQARGLAAADQAQGAPSTLGPTRASVAATTSGGSDECRDSFRNLYWWRTPDLDWRFNPAGTPRYLRDDDGGTQGIQVALRRAERNIITSRNVCDRPDRVSARGSYMGKTQRHPNVSSGTSCVGGDGRSVIQFAPLPSYSIAITCVYGMRRNIAAEADIRINSATTRWALNRRGCTGSELLLEAAMTHEFGHAYGLAHASTIRNPQLTMQPLVRACSGGHSSLGLGDMLGLERKY